MEYLADLTKFKTKKAEVAFYRFLVNWIKAYFDDLYSTTAFIYMLRMVFKKNNF